MLELKAVCVQFYATHIIWNGITYTVPTAWKDEYAIQKALWIAQANVTGGVGTSREAVARPTLRGLANESGYFDEIV